MKKFIGFAAAAIVAITAGVFAFHGTALAHHTDLSVSYECAETYTVEADYIGGSSTATAKVFVDGVLDGTFTFPGSGPDFVDNFYVKTGPVSDHPEFTVVLYIGGNEVDRDTVTVGDGVACTSTPTATPTITNTPTVTSTNTPTSTATATSTSTGTSTPESTVTSTPTTTPTATSTFPSDNPKSPETTPPVRFPDTGTGGDADSDFDRDSAYIVIGVVMLALAVLLFIYFSIGSK